MGDALRTVSQAMVALLGTQEIRTLAMATWHQMKEMQVCNDPSSDSGTSAYRKQVGIGGISAY